MKTGRITRNHIVFISVVFICCYFYLSNTIPYDSDWMPLQVSTFLIAIIAIFLGSSSISIKKVLWITVICQFLNHLILLNSSMPTMSGDGDNYIFVAKKVAEYSNLLDGFKAFLHGIRGSYYYELSDLGYVSILSTLYYVFGTPIADFVDIVLKICSHTATVYFMYKIFDENISCDDKRSIGLLVGLIFGVNVFPAYLSYGILKESYFVFTVVLSVYWMYRLSNRFNVRNLIIFVFCVFWSYMFRGIMPLYFIGSYFLFIFLRNKNPFMTQVVVTSMFALSIVGMSIILRLFPEVETSFTARGEKYDTSLVGMLMNITGPFISPIPALNKYNINSNLCVFSYSVINISFAYFALLGIFNTLKNGIVQMYPILFVVLLNSIMVILTGYAINARYTYIVAPLYYSFIPFGFRFHRKIFLLFYMIGIVVLTYMYNDRL